MFSKANDALLQKKFQKQLALAKEKIFSKGDPIAQVYIGYAYNNGLGIEQNNSKAVEWYQKAANQRNPKAQFCLGFMYANGRGVAKDEKKAYEFYQLAANQGHAKAQFYLGVMYAYGRGVAKDEKKACELFQLAANQGDADAQYNLGFMYANSQGVAKDEKKACELFQLAANQGDVDAQFYLGFMYANGHKDEKKAYEFYQLAANQKSSEAQFQLGYLYEAGKGVVVDVNKALEYYQKAASEGHTDAKKRFKDLQAMRASADSYIIDYKEISFGKKLCKGGFGIVYQGTWRHSDVAVKKLLDNNPSEEEAKEFENESQTMARLHAPNIVQFYGCCLSPKYCIVMEYMPNGSLFNILHSQQLLTWETRNNIATDMAIGLAFLHEEKILHRDIKSPNILLNKNFQAKLTDFGLSKVNTKTDINSINKDLVGTLVWMAPERLQYAVYTEKADIYSFGMTLWELASRKIPFADSVDDAALVQKIIHGKREDIPADCPSKLTSLITACWEGEPEKRPTANNVVTYLKSDMEDFNQFKAFLLNFQQQVASATSAARQGEPQAKSSSPR